MDSDNRMTLVPEAPVTDVIAVFQAHALAMPDKPFVCLETPRDRRVVAYGEALDRIARLQGKFEAAGLGSDDVVLVFLPQGWEAIANYLGAMAQGCIPSFMPCPSSKQDPQRYWAGHKALLARIEPRAVITDSANAAQMRTAGLADVVRQLIVVDQVEAAAPPGRLRAFDPDATALLQHSSGTTGLKKGVMLSHRSLLRQVDSYASAIPADKDDVVVSWLPLYHDMGLVACLIMPMVLGQTIVLLDPFHWVARPGSLFEAIDQHQGTLCWLPNFAFEHISRIVPAVGTGGRLSSMKAFINCSEPCRAETFDRFATKFAPLGARIEMLQACYAMAETTFAVTQTPSGRPARTVRADYRALSELRRIEEPASGSRPVQLLSSGVPIDGVQIEIRAPDGQRVSDGHVGDIWISAPFLFDGYYRLQDETNKRLVNGRYQTNDLGIMLDGEVFVLGRSDDLIIVNGRNFHSAEVEQVVSDIAGLKPGRNVAFGLDNQERGTRDLVVVAEVDGPANTSPLEVPAPDLKSLRGSVRHGIFETFGIYPTDVMLVPQGWLLKTSSGKIERGSNAEKYLRSRTERPTDRSEST